MRLKIPAFIDLHVHLREPGQTHKGDIAHETRAALAGGFHTILAMPNTLPPPDTPERFLEIEGLIREKAAAGCRVMLTGCLTAGRNGKEPTDAQALKEAGALALSDDGSTPQDTGVMREVARRTAEAGLLVVDHCEDAESTRRGEIAMVERDIELAGETGARFHLQHLSTMEAVGLLSDAQKSGLHVSGEATPHHLALTAAAIDTFGTNAKMAPPLRDEADRRALVKAVADGVIAVIATDHAPHSTEEKALPFPRAPNGILGLESAFSVCNRVLVESGPVSFQRMIDALTAAPARILGIPLPDSEILVETEGCFTIPPPVCSMASNCPWTGFQGWGYVIG